MEDLVTGVTTSVEVDTGLSPEQVWALVSDVTRIGEWSPECVRATWLDESRFRAWNEGEGFSTTVECVVTESEAPRVFAWTVLDAEGLAGSLWRYELSPSDVGTLIRHTFTHGPGLTGLREGAEVNPAVVPKRLATLQRNMAATLHAMIGAS